MKLLLALSLWLSFTAGQVLASAKINKELPRKITFTIFDYKSNQRLFDGEETITWVGSEVTRKTNYSRTKDSESVQNEVVVYDFNSLVVSYYEVKNTLVGEDITVKLQDKVYEVTIKRDNKTTKKSLSLKKGLYLGKVLHHLKLRNWSRFSEKPFVFDLLVPFQGDFYAFQIARLKRDQKYPKLDKLSLQPDSWIVRRFVDPITFYHDPSSKRVIHYIGPSNIEEKEVESRMVRIDFNY